LSLISDRIDRRAQYQATAADRRAPKSPHIGVIAAQGYAVEADDIRGRAVEKLQTVD
jgi:hypothetical protein